MFEFEFVAYNSLSFVEPKSSRTLCSTRGRTLGGATGGGSCNELKFVCLPLNFAVVCLHAAFREDKSVLVIIYQPVWY
jgi:hypothetical protein